VSLDSPDSAQAVLNVGARDDLGRPESVGTAVRCLCGRDVTETRKPHRVDCSYLADRATVDLEADTIPVFGWRCDVCSRVLALDPSRTDNEFGPGDGWLTVQADLATSSGHVLVPRRAVHE
jgi:hypothetical protein